VTPFDLAILATLVLSTLFAFIRGFIRELIALVAWVVGFAAAFAFAPLVGGWIPEIPGYPAVRYLIAFAAILIAALVVGALIAGPLVRVIHAAGLGFVDRFLGSMFGVARGVLLVLAFVLVAGLTTLPRANWWQNSALAPPFVAAALVLKPWLPERWAERLDFSRDGAPRAPSQQKA
jgi:membrane protein required for colicin V production